MGQKKQPIKHRGFLDKLRRRWRHSLQLIKQIAYCFRKSWWVLNNKLGQRKTFYLAGAF